MTAKSVTDALIGQRTHLSNLGGIFDAVVVNQAQEILGIFPSEADALIGQKPH